MSVSVAVCRRHASAVLAALSEHTDTVKVALLPTFKELNTIYQFDLAILSTVAGVSFDTIELMLNDEAVKEEEARLILRAASKQSRQVYTLNNVDVNLLKETAGTLTPLRGAKERRPS